MKKIIGLTTTIVGAMSAAGGAHASIISNTLGDNLNPWSPIYYDFNGDSVNDIEFYHTYTSYSGSSSGYTYGDLTAYGLNGSLVTISGPISADTIIDGGTAFATSNYLADYNYSWWSGSCDRWGCSPGGSDLSMLGTWNDGFTTVTGYLGFSLFDGIDTSYGWVNMSMYADGGGVINSFGLETTYGQGIKAGDTGASAQNRSNVPEPSTLSLLALGAVGVGSVRRRLKRNKSVAIHA